DRKPRGGNVIIYTRCIERPVDLEVGTDVLAGEALAEGVGLEEFRRHLDMAEPVGAQIDDAGRLHREGGRGKRRLEVDAAPGAQRQRGVDGELGLEQAGIANDEVRPRPAEDVEGAVLAGDLQ